MSSLLALGTNSTRGTAAGGVEVTWSFVGVQEEGGISLLDTAPFLLRPCAEDEFPSSANVYTLTVLLY